VKTWEHGSRAIQGNCKMAKTWGAWMVWKVSKRFYSVLIIAIAALLFSPTAWGQATGSFSATVTDKSGSAVSGVTVMVTAQGTGAVRETTTDEAGHYTVNPANTHPHALCLQAFTC